MAEIEQCYTVTHKFYMKIVKPVMLYGSEGGHLCSRLYTRWVKEIDVKIDVYKWLDNIRNNHHHTKCARITQRDRNKKTHEIV